MRKDFFESEIGRGMFRASGAVEARDLGPNSLRQNDPILTGNALTVPAR